MYINAHIILDCTVKKTLALHASLHTKEKNVAVSQGSFFSSKILFLSRDTDRALLIHSLRGNFRRKRHGLFIIITLPFSFFSVHRKSNSTAAWSFFLFPGVRARILISSCDTISSLLFCFVAVTDIALFL